MNEADAVNYWPLMGIALVVIGFALRLNPLFVVVGAAVATGLLAGLDVVAVVEALGKAFNDNRYISVTWIILPVIGLLERYGLQQRARGLIESIRGATMGKLLTIYLLFRQVTAALGQGLVFDLDPEAGVAKPCDFHGFPPMFR